MQKGPGSYPIVCPPHAPPGCNRPGPQCRTMTPQLTWHVWPPMRWSRYPMQRFSFADIDPSKRSVAQASSLIHRMSQWLQELPKMFHLPPGIVEFASKTDSVRDQNITPLTVQRLEQIAPNARDQRVIHNQF